MQWGRVHHLHHELRVLSQAVSHANLSAAAQHIGISQPQLSRIIQRLESELGMVLLDRAAKRKSGWLPQAIQLGEMYTRLSIRMEAELRSSLLGGETETLRVGTLEGCIPIMNRILARAVSKLKLRILEVEVEDLGNLEKRFMKGELDVILSFRAPGKKKYRFEIEIGLQKIEIVRRKLGARIQGLNQVRLLSSFEAEGGAEKNEHPQSSLMIVSNSLEVRRNWLNEFGGEGSLPGELLRNTKPSGSATDRAGQATLSLYASDVLASDVWKQLELAAAKA